MLDLHGATSRATQIADWKTAGGLDAKTFMYGNWSSHGYGAADGSWNYAFLVSDYGYRNVAVGIFNPWHKRREDIGCSEEKWGAGVDYRPIFLGVKPRQHVQIGTPYFRTVRALGARAIVSDAFGKGGKLDALGRNFESYNDSAPISSSAEMAGVGVKAHRTAYNALYGDWHVQVFGDPQERFVWHTQGRNGVTYANTDYNTLNMNYFLGGWTTIAHPYLVPADGVNDMGFAHTALAMWHDLDNQVGVDVGVDE